MTPPARLGLAIALALTTLPAYAGDPTTEQLLARIAALEQRLAAVEAANAAPAATVAPEELDQRLRVVERRQELDAEAAATKVAATPVLALGEKGLSVKNAAGDFEVKLRGLVQADARYFGGDTAATQTDTFLFRRIRPTLEGSWGKLVGFRLTPEFAGDSATIVDAYVDLKFDPRATVRIGKVKGPVGLERLQSGGAIAFIERGFPTELAPNRDIGAQLQGEFGNGLSYALGVYNGTVDGRDAVASNPDGDFEVAGRVFLEPWKNDANALSGLGFGLAASRGDKHGSGNNFLPRYRTPGQVQFFNYRSTVLADGEHLRVSPQAYYYGGRLGLLGEYITSSQEVRAANGSRADLENSAWQITAGWVLTGEDASYKGVVKPANAFGLGDGSGWGAFELVGRVGRLDIDDDAFPLFADPAAVSAAARSWGIGLNWYLNSNFKLVTNYTNTSFDAFGTATPRSDEKTVFTRAQFSF